VTSVPELDDGAPLDDEELTELRYLVERARVDEVEWEPTQPDLWNRIAAEVGAPPHYTNIPMGSRDEAPADNPRHRWWRAGVAGLAAAAAAIVAVVAVVVVDNDEPDVQVVSAVDLEPIVGSGSGRAELVSVNDALQLRLETEGLDTPEGYFEVWLIDPTVTQLISLGPLREDGQYDVPAGVDAAAFPVVDVSVEPVDGNPAHSGTSVLRGQLPA
jgi:anti-sigma-K factor RskA